VHERREVVNAVRWLVRTGSPWRYLPNPPEAGRAMCVRVVTAGDTLQHIVLQPA
jgi:hypothetical protein